MGGVMKSFSSKNIDGITDLVVVAPIRQGFIHAYENVTYATRLRIVAEALNRVRVSVREHETITPFSDVTERILTLLDFRIGVLDKDVFALDVARRRGGAGAGQGEGVKVESRRFLYLTATFDGAWEPYMRLIWKPLGPFLDLLFCNCEGYVTASEHCFEEYAQWVRDNQVDSAIFYAATGLTVRDHLYLSRLEYLTRSRPAAAADREIGCMTMPKPEEAAAAERAFAMERLAEKDVRHVVKIHELALEALTVLYRLADYYPPGWLAGRDKFNEGHYLVLVSEALLHGWNELLAKAPLSEVAERTYADPLNWYRSGLAELRRIESEQPPPRPDPAYDPAEVQGGILKAQGSKDEPMRRGALLLMTITDAEEARRFLSRLETDGEINFLAEPGSAPGDGFFRTVALTAHGLRRLGLPKPVFDLFPSEFREGMEARSGLVGDMRGNHPRNWTLPPRNWPQPDGDPRAMPRPPIDPSEIDIVLQVRTASTEREVLMKEIGRLAEAAADGATLQGFEPMCATYDDDGLLVDYFGFHDGVSQPKPIDPTATQPDDARAYYKDEVRLGEILLGYGNDREDSAPDAFSHDDGREKDRAKARDIQFNGTFLVIRKLEQKVDAFERTIASETQRINAHHPGLPTPMTEDRLKARLLGRNVDGRPLVRPRGGGRNDFDYRNDKEGLSCPHASHIRRTNPREPFQGRNAPRILRRGMSFDHSGEAGGEGARGLMFMAYNSSIAEQFETIQRWINGGNSTFVASGHSDPIAGVAPKTGALDQATRVFRFVEGGEVVRVTMNEPFVKLHWGAYLFVPSRSGLRKLCELKGRYEPFREFLETHGATAISRLVSINNPQTKQSEWKRLLEDFDAKDPSQNDITSDVWSAIRWYYGGAFKIPPGTPLTSDWNVAPDPDLQPIVLAASYRHVMAVLTDWKTYSTEEQLRRIAPTGIPIYVAQQPDDQYKNGDLQNRFNYWKESEATNEILMAYDEGRGFEDGYKAGLQVIEKAKERAATSRLDYFKLELRRQYLLPALGLLCKIWYGLPDGENFHLGAWTWQPPEERDPKGPRCPGDFLAPSRYTFYPRPTEWVKTFGEQHGRAVYDGSLAFVRKHRPSSRRKELGTIAQAMFDKTDDDDVLARNLVGTMIGAIPPMDGNLRGILLEWLDERTLWRQQAALRRALGDRSALADPTSAREVLRGPVSQAMCKRPAPDLIYRTATCPARLKARNGNSDRTDDSEHYVEVNERDLVVVSLVSAAQRSLEHYPDGDVSVIFGGNRPERDSPEAGEPFPVHACPAQKMAMGAIMGILAALLDSGRIQALPASLIVRVSDWARAAPRPAP